MLLQLMVYAKIIYLLMVVISGALCTVEDYVIMSQCAHNKAIYLAAEGTVSVTDISQIQNITIVGRPDFVNNNFKIALYAKETQRYLCFNDHWKLVGMKELQDTCYFNEAIVHGYFVFRSVVDLQRRIGFTQRGRAVGPKKTVNDACYMFTKIPTDQFFHQHTHFSTTKTKSLTTKTPKTEYTHTPYTTTPGRGNGSGVGGVRTKPNNRLKNPHHHGDAAAQSHSGNGSGSGSGNGGGGGSGSINKKWKKQRNGNKQRQQKQEMQQQMRGHNYNLSNPKNSTYLNSSRQNLVLSENSFNNNNINTSRKHNNNNNNNSNIKSNNNNNNKHPPQNHQVRHHHNDPNKVAKRQQHDQKQKTRQRQRLKPSTSTSTSTSTVSVLTTSSTSSTTTTTTDKTTVINSTKPHYTLSTSQSEINPTSVTATFSTASSAHRNTQSSTVVVTKRKGRRRKGEKLHKKSGLQKKHMHEENTKDLLDKSHTYTSSAGPTYEAQDEYSSSSTDYAKPTSASLPSWETWYPTTIFNDENSNYSSSDSVSMSSSTEIYDDNRFSTTLESSPMTDIENNTLTLQTSSVPLPTLVFATTLTDNSIDETILPSSVITDLEATTATNTSTYTQTDYWSTSLNDNTSLDSDIMDMYVTKQLDFDYKTPQLEDVHMYGLNTERYLEDTSVSTNNPETKQTTDAITITLSTSNNDDEFKRTAFDESEKINLDSKTKEAKTTTSTTAIDASHCAYSTMTTMTTTTTTTTKTGCIYATKIPEPIDNYHSSGPKKTEQFFRENSSNTKATTTTTTTATTRTNIITNLSKASTSQSPPPTTQTQVERELERKTGTEIATTATTLISAKSSALLTPITTRRTLRKSTQRLLATPFHQLTYVRNEAGDIDIDSIDNISIYPEIIDSDNIDEPLVKSSTSRLTMISGYLPTSATATLPESIRIAKIKINRERKRIMRLRNVGNYA